MSQWPSSKARKVLKALQHIGWIEVRRVGSHRVLRSEGKPDFIFAFDDGEEIGPRMFSRLAKHTGLTPEDL